MWVVGLKECAVVQSERIVGFETSGSVLYADCTDRAHGEPLMLGAYENRKSAKYALDILLERMDRGGSCALVPTQAEVDRYRTDEAKEIRL